MKPTIPFSDFSKLELLIGTIISIDIIEDAENLYLLKVDLGESGKRQLVAGLAKAYDSEKLMGEQIVVVANLEGKEIRGVKSEGMLLAADVDGQPVILNPEKQVKPGTKVR